MTLVIENVEEKYVEVFKALAKGVHARVREVEAKPTKRLRKAIRECEEEKAEVLKVHVYASLDDYLQAHDIKKGY